MINKYGLLSLIIMIFIYSVVLFLPEFNHSNPSKGFEKNQKELIQMIEQKAKKNFISPINATLDPVWKAIPGYNGIEIDLNATYQANKKNPNLENIQYIYKEIEPIIQLENLGNYPIYKGNPKKNMVSIMINVAWGNEYIPDILETLKNEKVKATFFFDGTWLNKHIAIAKNISQDGHELSNHGYTHRNMSELTRSEVIQEISRTQNLLLNDLHVKNVLFAPPSGDFNQQTIDIAKEFGLYTVLWTIDTIDWKKPGIDAILQRVKRNLQPGSLILMHPTLPTKRALPYLIQMIKEKGYHFGTVSQTLSSKRIDVNILANHDL